MQQQQHLVLTKLGATLLPPLQLTKSMGHIENVRVRTVNLQGKKKVFTLKTDNVNWPMMQLLCTDGEWQIVDDAAGLES